MKDFRILIIALFFPLIVSCQPSTEDAIKYSDGITEQQIEVNEKFSILISSYDAYVSDEMDIAYNNTIGQIDKGVEYVNKLEGFEEDAYFREGALAFFKSYKEVLENEHKKIIGLYKLPENEYGTEQVKEVEKLRNQSNIKIDKSFENMFTAQKKFAEKYHIKLEEAEVQ